MKIFHQGLILVAVPLAIELAIDGTLIAHMNAVFLQIARPKPVNSGFV